MNDSNQNNKLGDQIALYILTERVNELKESYRQKDDRDVQLFQQLTESQRLISERVLVVETNQEHVANAIIKLQKDSSLQTRLLTGILLTAISAVVTIIVKGIGA